VSSHHIVREKQEPALLVLGLDTFPAEMLGQLLEWNPTVITTKETAQQLIDFGIKIDWIITDDSNSHIQSDVKLMPVGNDTPAEAALKYLVTHNYPAVNIICDDLQLKDYLFFADKINLVIFHNDQKIYPVYSGFSKWKPAGDKIEILTHPHEVRYSGLESLGNHQFATMNDGFFSLRFDEPPFLFIAEKI
jgi:thiamine pyrophosphokinase